MLSKTLKNGTKDHDTRTEHDGPSSTKSLGKPGRKGDRKDRAKLVRGVDETKQTRFNSPVAIRVCSTITQV